MGSDGTLGLRAIKEKAGAAFVQSLASAKFDGMPRSAIDAGLADVVAAGRRAARLRSLAISSTRLTSSQPEPALAESRTARSRRSSSCCAAHTGNDFSLYKRSTICRRIERRMGLHQLDKIADYVRYPAGEPARGRAAVQRAADRRHELLPRPGGVGRT